ncbi:hypothetical protein T01_14058 [Trichinella spiralis]|uniref:Uncharacterized protein n=1 Tax=Trichinella spiralis TaxID=6334 RepID=A0A0V1BDT1_TRISP|nr:hypothetical protein T01_14058 [Trichinella spiralis]
MDGCASASEQRAGTKPHGKMRTSLITMICNIEILLAIRRSFGCSGHFDSRKYVSIYMILQKERCVQTVFLGTMNTGMIVASLKVEDRFSN